MLLGVANDVLWRKFCDIAGLATVADDPRFRTNADRVAHRAATVGLVQSVMITRTSDEWVRLLSDAGIPASPIHSFADVSRHPHTAASGMVMEITHARYGTLKAVAQPIVFDGQRNAPSRPPPLHGEHTTSILKDLGYSEEAIARLREDNTVFAR